MGKDAPQWKGKLIDRSYLKSEIKEAFTRIAKSGNTDAEIGRLVNTLERYLLGELLLNTREVMNGIKDTLEGSMEYLEDLAGGIADVQIRRRAEQLSGGEKPLGPDES